MVSFTVSPGKSTQAMNGRFSDIRFLVLALTLPLTLLGACAANRDNEQENKNSTCGNGLIDPGESCDGIQLGGASCESLGYAGGGSLGCKADCTFDTGDCQESPCGNGVIDGNEQCDRANLASTTCQDLGYGGGTLRCTSTCQFDTSACEQNGNSIAATPPLNQWTPSFQIETDCTCSAQNTDCHALYVGRVTAVNGNTATLEFQKTGGGGPSVSVSYWVVVNEDTFPSCVEIQNYVTRVQGTWPTGTAPLTVDVDIWPTAQDFQNAGCGDVKALFIITGGAGDENSRVWFQKQAIHFRKVCQ